MYLYADISVNECISFTGMTPPVNTNEWMLLHKHVIKIMFEKLKLLTNAFHKHL